MKLNETLIANGWENLAAADLKKVRTILTQQPAALTQITLIGSPIYTALFKAVKTSSAGKLNLVLKQAAAFLDENGFLQIGSQQIYPFLSPHDPFLTAFRKEVRRAFPAKSLQAYAVQSNNVKLAKLARQIHLFRSWLDWQNIRYIRCYFGGENDFEKLLNYCQMYRIKLDYSTTARFHNRYLKNQQFIYPQNFKVQIDYRTRMSEFIVDLTTQNFVTEWNVYHQLENGLIDSDPLNYSGFPKGEVVNTGSFNYGLPKGKWAWLLKFSSSHQRLDIMHPADSQIRRKAIRSSWQTPLSYRQGGNYADLVVKGQQDIVCWSKVPPSQKIIAYHEFVTACKKRLPRKNHGFYCFWAQKKS